MEIKLGMVTWESQPLSSYYTIVHNVQTESPNIVCTYMYTYTRFISNMLLGYRVNVS